jgi:hypothetical protein
MRNDMGNRPAKSLLPRRVIQRIDPSLVPSASIGDCPRNRRQVTGGAIESLDHFMHRPATRLVVQIGAHRLARHQIGPDFNIANDMEKRSPRRAMTDVELPIELAIC